MGENFNLKLEPQMKKITSNTRFNYIHQHSDYKRKVYTISSIYVSTTFEYQVPEMYASQKTQVFFLDFEAGNTFPF